MAGWVRRVRFIRVNFCRLAVYIHVDYLCKTTPNLCAQWKILRIVMPGRVHNMAFTWEDAVCALCINKEPELSTRHAAKSDK
jgi:hypothetical protein